MIRFLLIVILLMVIARSFWRTVDGIIEGASGRPRGRQPGKSATKLVRDPVCGTYVVPSEALSLTAGGSTHYFCSDTCRAKYNRGSA